VVAQKFAVDIEATGRKNLPLRGHHCLMPAKELQVGAQSLLERFGLEPAADITSETYSGGTRPELDVASGLVHRPEVLSLDEPITDLDPAARVEVGPEIAHLTKVEGLTVLLATHYPKAAEAPRPRVGLGQLRSGRRGVRAIEPQEPCSPSASGDRGSPQSGGRRTGGHWALARPKGTVLATSRSAFRWRVPKAVPCSRVDTPAADGT